MSVREGEGDVAVGNMLVVNIQRTAAAAVPRGTRAEPVLLVLCGVAVFVSSPRTHPPRLRRQIVPRRRVCFRTALCLLLLGRELFKCSRMCQWDTVHRCGKNSKQGSAHAQRARHTDTHTHTHCSSMKLMHFSRSPSRWVTWQVFFLSQKKRLKSLQWLDEWVCECATLSLLTIDVFKTRLPKCDETIWAPGLIMTRLFSKLFRPNETVWISRLSSPGLLWRRGRSNFALVWAHRGLLALKFSLTAADLRNGSWLIIIKLKVHSLACSGAFDRFKQSSSSNWVSSVNTGSVDDKTFHLVTDL